MSTSPTCHLEPTTKAYVKLQWQIIEQLFLRINELTSEELHALGEAKNKLEVIMATGDMSDFEKSRFPDVLAVWLEKEALKIPFLKEELKYIYDVIQSDEVDKAPVATERKKFIIDERSKYKTIREEYAFMFDCNTDNVAFSSDELKKDTVVYLGDIFTLTPKDEIFSNIKYIKGEIKLHSESIGEKFKIEVAQWLLQIKKCEIVTNNFEKFSDLNADVAFRVIEQGAGCSVANNIEKFPSLNHPDIALRLIEKGSGWSVGPNLKKFFGLNHPDIALRLIEKAEGSTVAINLEKFSGLNHPDIALRLIEKGCGTSVVDNLEKFSGLNHPDIALRLIEKGEGTFVARNLEKFSGLNHPDIALRLIEKEHGSSVISNLQKFSGLNADVALRLIEKGEGAFVARNLQKFAGLNADVALRLIEKGEGAFVAKNLKKFSGLNQTIMAKLRGR